MIQLLISLAAAADPCVAVGAHTTTNDPFIQQRVLSAGLLVDPWAWGEVGVTAAAGWPFAVGRTELGKSLTNQFGLEPDVSYVTARTQLDARVFPFHAEVGATRARVGAGVGVAAVHTRDATLSDTPYPDAKQWHPATAAGLVGEVRGPHAGVRLRMEQTWSTESVAGVLMRREWLWAGVELVVFPGGEQQP
jgi:hypothetical protein